MKNFNENPFKKNTPVVPFSNGTEAMIYAENNCHNCIKYSNESQNEENAKCKLAFHLDMGAVSGDIPLWVAKEIGCTYDPLYGSVKLYNKCREFSDGTEPF
ncbi:MAG: hypothetical protein CMP76_17175 [Flavobacterium sp.]|uniref:hypothetical protein n=1 Tax=Flavobacterium sp. TaxID=239 RepID=UPI000C3BD6B6|nr:hypothetical protein [Flavobacterium sp.]MBF05011.1 hypothetical protein [Flavobacterium sp.]|tara:strand:- start:811 stop:1113 length:303 start_codon:yes stop_codon:yes gene_type:complete